MSHHQPRLADHFVTRRDFLCKTGMGMGALAFTQLMSSIGFAPVTNAAEGINETSPLAPRTPHFPAKAKRVIHIFANGGPSHVDTFDPKPELTKWAGKEVPNHRATERKTGAAFASPFSFKNYGKSGIEVSELFSNVAESIDDICVIRSMHADVPNHEPSLLLMNCGDARQIRPSMGSWLTYGLGSENQNLPGFVVMCPGGYPIQESQNWQSAFLPGVFQGTYIDSLHKTIEKLIENIKNNTTSLKEQRRQLDLVDALNKEHLRKRAADAQLEARMQSFELAFRMQKDASDAFDISQEPEHVRALYGIVPNAPGGREQQGRQMLIARRLVERGVRFVQVWHGAGQPWDNHDDIEKGHRALADDCDQPIGGLLKDLKQRGMLQDTLVIWGGEFGRTPTVELPTPGANAGKINGRDHNHYGFTMWMAGGGVKGGYVHGATDEFGFAATEKPVHVHDLHATILQLCGFDHTRLTYRSSGRDFRLTDVHGNVIREIIA